MTRRNLIKYALSLHIIVSVALLGDSAGYLAIAIKASQQTDPLVIKTHYEILQMLGFVFGVPLSFLALLSGLWLTYLTKWKLLRYPWVIVKFLLIITVILVGAFILRDGMDTMLHGKGGAEGRLIYGAVYDVLALILATLLSVFKPGKRGGIKAESNQP